MATADESKVIIPDDEAELYDRQIRLWGAEAQKSIRNIKVLVIGARTVGAELCKNLILSGIKSLTLMDSEKVTEEDMLPQFFLEQNSLGKNRAKASLFNLQKLNSHVHVSSDTDSPLDKSITFYSEFDVVCVTNQIVPIVVCLNHICRHFAIKFFCCDVIGSFGYSFTDIKPYNAITPLKPNLNTFVTFESIINNVSISDLKLKVGDKRSDPSYLLFRVLIEFFTQYKRKPNTTLEGDLDKLLQIRTSVLDKYQLPKDDQYLPLHFLEDTVDEFGPSCVIVAGFLAQEVLRTFYSKRRNNIKFFNPFVNLGAQYSFYETSCLRLWHSFVTKKELLEMVK